VWGGGRRDKKDFLPGAIVIGPRGKILTQKEMRVLTGRP